MHCANSYLTRAEGKQFEVYDSELLNGLLLYFIGSPDSPYDLHKGLWFDGNIGTGKTTLMNVFRAFLIKLRKGFMIHTAADITSSYSISGDLDTYVNNHNGYSGQPIELCIDELGREQMPAMHFGNKLNVVQHILHQRYGLWQRRGIITHVTTNLTPNEVKVRYEDFIFDRCRHMFNIVTIGGYSKR